eukprot:1456350-Rhodomonas_salina.1
MANGTELGEEGGGRREKGSMRKEGRARGEEGGARAGREEEKGHGALLRGEGRRTTKVKAGRRGDEKRGGRNKEGEGGGRDKNTQQHLICKMPCEPSRIMETVICKARATAHVQIPWRRLGSVRMVTCPARGAGAHHVTEHVTCSTRSEAAVTHVSRTRDPASAGRSRDAEPDHVSATGSGRLRLGLRQSRQHGRRTCVGVEQLAPVEADDSSWERGSQTGRRTS